MFILLNNSIQLFFVFCGLVIFFLVSWRRLDFGLSLVIFLAPLYLLKIVIGWLPLTVLELLILAVLAVWLVKKTLAGFSFDLFRRFGFWEFSFPALLVLIGIFISTLASADLRVSAGIFKSWFVEPIIFSLLVVDTAKNSRQARNLLLAAVFSGVAVAAIGLGYLLAGDLTFDGRLKAFYLSPNHLAMYLAPALLLVIGFLVGAKNFWQKILLVVSGWLLAVSIYYTFSYSAWLAIVAALIFMFLASYKFKLIANRKIAIGGLAIVLFVFLFLILFQWGDVKLGNLLKFDRSSLESRLMVWRAGWQIIKDHWLLGIGPGEFQKYYLDYQKFFKTPYLEWAVTQPHNLFLAFWLQTGIFGLVGFIWLIVNFFKKTFNFLKQKTSFAEASEARQPLAVTLMAVIFYILAHGLADTTYWKNDLALMFWLIITLCYTVVRLRD